MELTGLKRAVAGFSAKGHPEKIKILGWYLHQHKQSQFFMPVDIKAVYEELHETLPSAFGGYFQSLCDQNVLLKNSSGYRLSASAREECDAAYGLRGHKVEVAKLLRDLPGQIPDLAERTYLDEALICYENAAFRAAVVMAWNLAYHHLCDHVVKRRLSEFNARWVISYPGDHKKATKAISVIDDFMEELKESQVIAICKDAGIITKDLWKIMDEKLGKRNSAAHASSVVISQLQADAFIDDLVKNLVLRIR